MKDRERKAIILGIECCLGIDDRRCSGCPCKRNRGQDDGRCAERLLRQALIAIQEDEQQIAELEDCIKRMTEGAELHE